MSFLIDLDKKSSTGRLAAAYLVLFGSLIYPVGIMLPAAAAYTTAFAFRAWEMALVLYVGTKVYDGVNAWKKSGNPQAPN